LAHRCRLSVSPLRWVEFEVQPGALTPYINKDKRSLTFYQH